MKAHATAERLDQARRLFFEGRDLPETLLSGVVVRSWQRSRELGRSFADKVIFNPVPRHAGRQLQEHHQQVLPTVQRHLQSLAALLRRDEWALSFLDAQGNVVTTLRADHPGFVGLAQAFRPGVNLGEQGAGTTGPSCALAEQRTVVISGKEHFLEEAAEFSCSAAPLFDAQGTLIGAINASRHFLGGHMGIPLAVERAARAIEAELVASLADSVIVEIDLAAGQGVGSPALLAFSPDGELLGSNRLARAILGAGAQIGADFSSLFEGSFAAAMDRLGASDAPLHLFGSEGLLLALRLFRAHPGVAGHKSQERESACAYPLLPPECARQLDGLVRAFRHEVPILLTGRTGTGKDELARWLHTQGPRKHGPFVAVNCAAIPPGLIEAELFGYAPGAFTGASRHGMSGKIEQAQGGTLLLDEIGDMPLELQSRLLRVLQERKICRIGAQKEIPVSFSLLAATHRNLKERVRDGSFREDLLYRIQGMQMHLPDLCERSDFSDVVQSILDKSRAPASPPITLTPRAMAALRAHPWPGNIRQLSSVLKVAAALSWRGLIDLEHLPGDLLDGVGARSQGAQGILEAAEARVIQRCLHEKRGNISATARHLGISRATLYKKLKAYQIVLPDEAH